MIAPEGRNSAPITELLEAVFPTNRFPLASSVIAWVKVMALPAVPLGAVNH